MKPSATNESEKGHRCSKWDNFLIGKRQHEYTGCHLWFLRVALRKGDFRIETCTNRDMNEESLLLELLRPG